MPFRAIITGSLAASLVVGAVRGARADDGIYETTVRPLLRARCIACHGALASEAGLRLDTAAAVTCPP